MDSQQQSQKNTPPGGNPPPDWRSPPPPHWGATPPPNWRTAPPPPGWPPRPSGESWLSRYGAGRKELVFALFAFISSLLVCNFTLFGGFNLGFGIAIGCYILCGGVYLLSRGCRPTGYSITLLLLSLVISSGFARSDDGFMKFLMVILLFLSVHLGLCITAGQNRFRTGSIRSIGDVFRTVFAIGYGQIGPAIGGLFGGMRGKASLGKRIGAVLLGLLITIPLISIVMPLLIEADAAFEAMMRVVPDINLLDTTVTFVFGVGAFILFYSRCVGLVRRPKETPIESGSGKGINSLTMNTVLSGVCLVYLLYLLSQLAYFVSGFSGMVPKGYTFAEYARRGFFEMAWLCVINMGIIVFASALVRKSNGRAPLSTRFLCLFIGLVTVFLAVVASGKMFTYIGGYGLTRRRVMTQLIIVFFGITAMAVSISLFTKKPRYMQVILITALVLSGTAFWADVDTVVATHNVNAYLDGRLETVDVQYLGELSNGAIPQIARLLRDDDPQVVREAQKILQDAEAQWDDFRDWNYAKGQAADCLEENKPYYEENFDGNTSDDAWSF